jgi:hypothetical protein
MRPYKVVFNNHSFAGPQAELTWRNALTSTASHAKPKQGFTFYHVQAELIGATYNETAVPRAHIDKQLQPIIIDSQAPKQSWRGVMLTSKQPSGWPSTYQRTSLLEPHLLRRWVRRRSVCVCVYVCVLKHIKRT